MTDYRCEGKCGRTVAADGKYCFTCWADIQTHPPTRHSIEAVLASIVNHPAPERRTAEGESLRLRLDILNLAYAYALGTEKERNHNLNKLDHLIHVAQHEHELNKDINPS